MVLFIGFALGRSFSKEAKGPLELVQKLELPSDEPCSDYRMWIKIKTAAGKVAWQDVCIGSLSEDMYQVALKWCENPKEITAIIRGDNDNFPKTSPRGETGDGPKTPDTSHPATSNDHEVQKAFSNLTESTSELTIEKTPTNGVEKYIPRAINAIEPFYLLETSDPDLDLIPLFIPIKEKKGKKKIIVGFEVLLVDKSGLEHFVQSELEKNRKHMDLAHRVECRDGSSRTFRFCPQVWIGSMFEHSKCLRRIFSKAEIIEAAQKEQLAELKGLDLFTNVQCWIADMYEFETAVECLSSLNKSDGVAQLLSPYYFSEHEAQYLGNLYASGNGKTLKEFLDELAKEDNVCTSHNLAPNLLNIFQISKNFRQDASFQNERKEWLEARIPSGGDAHGAVSSPKSWTAALLQLHWKQHNSYLPHPRPQMTIPVGIQRGVKEEG